MCTWKRAISGSFQLAKVVSLNGTPCVAHAAGIDIISRFYCTAGWGGGKRAIPNLADETNANETEAVCLSDIYKPQADIILKRQPLCQRDWRDVTLHVIICKIWKCGVGNTVGKLTSMTDEHIKDHLTAPVPKHKSKEICRGLASYSSIWSIVRNFPTFFLKRISLPISRFFQLRSHLRHVSLQRVTCNYVNISLTRFCLPSLALPLPTSQIDYLTVMTAFFCPVMIGCFFLAVMTGVPVRKLDTLYKIMIINHYFFCRVCFS